MERPVSERVCVGAAGQDIKIKIKVKLQGKFLYSSLPG